MTVAALSEGEDYLALSHYPRTPSTPPSSPRRSPSQTPELPTEIEAPIVITDPPEHTRLRKLGIGALSHQRALRLEPVSRTFVVERVERLYTAGAGDVVANLLRPLPSLVVARCVGVPRED